MYVCVRGFVISAPCSQNLARGFPPMFHLHHGYPCMGAPYQLGYLSLVASLLEGVGLEMTFFLSGPSRYLFSKYQGGRSL